MLVFRKPPKSSSITSIHPWLDHHPWLVIVGFERRFVLNMRWEWLLLFLTSFMEQCTVTTPLEGVWKCSTKLFITKQQSLSQRILNWVDSMLRWHSSRQLGIGPASFRSKLKEAVRLWTSTLGVFIIYNKKSGNFGWTVNGKAILVCQTGKFPK